VVSFTAARPLIMTARDAADHLRRNPVTVAAGH
jgi:hypothetical protein